MCVLPKSFCFPAEDSLICFFFTGLKIILLSCGRLMEGQLACEKERGIRFASVTGSSSDSPGGGGGGCFMKNVLDISL